MSANLMAEVSERSFRRRRLCRNSKLREQHQRNSLLFEFAIGDMEFGIGTSRLARGYSRNSAAAAVWIFEEFQELLSRLLDARRTQLSPR